jgi:hypothetical protein
VATYICILLGPNPKEPLEVSSLPADDLASAVDKAHLRAMRYASAEAFEIWLDGV